MLTMCPDPRSVICGSTAFEQTNGPRAFTRSTSSQRDRGKSATGVDQFVPALLISMSIRPKRRSVSSIIDVTAASSVTSRSTGRARRPRSSTIAAVSSMVPGTGSRRAATTMSAPCSASSTAMARPMPRLLPVTIATRPSNTPCASGISSTPSLCCERSALFRFRRGHSRPCTARSGHWQIDGWKAAKVNAKFVAFSR